MTDCHYCYGERTGVCKRTNTIFKDKECPHYVSIFHENNAKPNNRKRKWKDGNSV